jgi:hypothetical protein
MNKKKNTPFNSWKKRPTISPESLKKGGKISGHRRKKTRSMSEIDEIVKNVKKENDEAQKETKNERSISDPVI